MVVSGTETGVVSNELRMEHVEMLQSKGLWYL